MANEEPRPGSARSRRGLGESRQAVSGEEQDLVAVAGYAAAARTRRRDRPGGAVRAADQGGRARVEVAHVVPAVVERLVLDRLGKQVRRRGVEEHIASAVGEEGAPDDRVGRFPGGSVGATGENRGPERGVAHVDVHARRRADGGIDAARALLPRNLEENVAAIGGDVLLGLGRDAVRWNAWVAIEAVGELGRAIHHVTHIEVVLALALDLDAWVDARRIAEERDLRPVGGDLLVRHRAKPAALVVGNADDLVLAGLEVAQVRNPIAGLARGAGAVDDTGAVSRNRSRPRPGLRNPSILDVHEDDLAGLHVASEHVPDVRISDGVVVVCQRRGGCGEEDVATVRGHVQRHRVLVRSHAGQGVDVYGLGFVDERGRG